MIFSLNFRSSAALAAQSRPIQYNICIWGNANVWDWGGRVVSSHHVNYSVSSDFHSLRVIHGGCQVIQGTVLLYCPHFERFNLYSSATWSYITSIINTNLAHISATKFGAHNDMDMMEIGERPNAFAEDKFNITPINQATVH